MKETGATLVWVQPRTLRQAGKTAEPSGAERNAHQLHLEAGKGFVPDTYGLIIRKDGGYIVDNVILKGTAIGQRTSRAYALPEDDSEMLALPIVKNDSSSAYDPCQCGENGYIFPGSPHCLEIGRIEIPLAPFRSESSLVNLELRFDDQGQLWVAVRIPDTGVERELSLWVG